MGRREREGRGGVEEGGGEGRDGKGSWWGARRKGGKWRGRRGNVWGRGLKEEGKESTLMRELC